MRIRDVQEGGGLIRRPHYVCACIVRIEAISKAELLLTEDKWLILLAQTDVVPQYETELKVPRK